MTIDKPEHKKFLLDVLQQIQVPGAIAELVVEVKHALRDAKVTPPDGPAHVVGT